ncbi:MAG: hypothetical protein LBQ28_09130 [Prevotellaceae bacterium]|jgi:hypothetical protein|nr:hypothetical protein [Prevotellaceae bacterium]
MDKLNIQGFTQYPLTKENLLLNQNMILLTARLAALGSSGNYILSGCTEAGGAVSDGYVVIAGEILPFQAGIKIATVAIVETNESATISGTTYENARVKRLVKFASGSGSGYYNWADFKRIKTLAELETLVNNSRPNVYVQPTEPAGAQNGDFWVIQ